jgi:hypothetical protein
MRGPAHNLQDWPWRPAVGAAWLLVLNGCAPVAVTTFGVGASTGVSHTLTGITYRTFSVPTPRVRGATMTALQRMGIKVSSSSKVEGSEVIKATANNREIEVELEPLTPNTTRMRVTAKNGLFYDSATATEIILHTEKVLDRAVAAKGG